MFQPKLNRATLERDPNLKREASDVHNAELWVAYLANLSGDRKLRLGTCFTLEWDERCIPERRGHSSGLNCLI